MQSDSDYKNTLPNEVDERPVSDMPHELRSVADGAAPLSRREAEAAGLSVTPDVVYGESDDSPNRDDQIDEHRGSASNAP